MHLSAIKRIVNRFNVDNLKEYVQQSLINVEQLHLSVLFARGLINKCITFKDTRDVSQF